MMKKALSLWQAKEKLYKKEDLNSKMLRMMMMMTWMMTLIMISRTKMIRMRMMILRKGKDLKKSLKDLD